MFQFATLRHLSYGAYLTAEFKAENYALQFETLNLGRARDVGIYLWSHPTLSRFGTQFS